MRAALAGQRRPGYSDRMRDEGAPGRCSLVVLALTLGCAGAAREAAPTPPASPPRAPETASASPVDPACGVLAPTLTSYDAIASDVVFSLEVAVDERGAWAPARPLDMPLHHASMIVWTDEEHRLDPRGGVRQRVIATGIGRLSIEQDEARHTWFATYGARVDHACPSDVAEP